MIERILDLLKKNNMTAAKLTEILKIHKSSVTEWKKGKTKPSIEIIIQISSLFHVSTDYLLLGKDMKEDSSITYTEEEKMLLTEYKKLDFKGQNAVRNTIQEESERMEKDCVTKRNLYYQNRA